MISDRMKNMLLEDIDSLIKPADEVAVIGADHFLDHALLLMTSNKYSVVPVIDEQSKVKGLISLSIIMNAIMEIEDVRFDKLGDIKVKEIMNTDYPVVNLNFKLEKVLTMLVHSSFISVVNDDGVLEGIITRQEILRGTNRIVHNFEKEYEVRERIKEGIQF